MNQEIRRECVINNGEASDLLVDVEAVTLNDVCFGKISWPLFSDAKTRTENHVNYREESTYAGINDDFASFLSPREYIARGGGKRKAHLCMC